MSAHTPGPWTLRKTDCGIGCCEVFDVFAKYPEDEAPDRRVAGVDGGNAVWLREGETDANAHLIAAAPDLLAALEECVGHVTGIAGTENPVAANARAAIAKARGR